MPASEIFAEKKYRYIIANIGIVRYYKTMLAFDPDTHTPPDAPVAVEARNAAVLAVQDAYLAVSHAERECERLRRLARGAPEHDEIIRLRDAVGKLTRGGWPRELLAARTDLQSARDRSSVEAAIAHLSREADRAWIDTRGD